MATKSTKTSKAPRPAPLPAKVKKQETRSSRRNRAKADVASKVPAVLKAVNANKSMGVAGRIVKSIMNPSSGGMRLATLNDCAPTSIVDLHSFTPVNTTTIVGNYPGTNSGVTWAFLFRDPLRPLVHLSTNVAAFRYGAVFPTGDHYAGLPNLTGTDQQLVPLYFTPVVGPTPHGAALFCGEIDGGDKAGYVWMDPSNSSFQCQLAVAVRVVLATTVTAKFYAYTSSGDAILLQLVQAVPAGGDFTFTFGSALDAYPELKHGAYVRAAVRVSTDTTWTAQIQLKTTGPLDIMSHLCPVNTVTHLNQLTQARVNAVSMLLSNGAAALYNDGFIQAVNVNSGVLWNSLMGLPDLSGYASDVNYFSGLFKKGLYTFLKPADAEDVEFYDYAVTDAVTSGVTQCGFPLERSRYVAVRVSSTSTSSAGVFAGLEYLVNTSMVLEFQTNDMWFDAEIPIESSAETDRARDILRRIPNFYENPTHLQALANAARGAGTFLKKHSGKIGVALSALFPKFTPLIAALTSALG